MRAPRWGETCRMPFELREHAASARVHRLKRACTLVRGWTSAVAVQQVVARCARCHMHRARFAYAARVWADAYDGLEARYTRRRRVMVHIARKERPLLRRGRLALALLAQDVGGSAQETILRVVCRQAPQARTLIQVHASLLCALTWREVGAAYTAPLERTQRRVHRRRPGRRGGEDHVRGATRDARRLPRDSMAQDPAAVRDDAAVQEGIARARALIDVQAREVSGVQALKDRMLHMHDDGDVADDQELQLDWDLYREVPATMEQEEALLLDYFRKLKFIYLELETKLRFLADLQDDPETGQEPQILSTADVTQRGT